MANCNQANGSDTLEKNAVECWKVAVDQINQIGQRRSEVNVFFISIMSLLFTGDVLGLGLSRNQIIIKVVIIIMSVFGIVVCGKWQEEIEAFRKMTNTKYQIIHLLENEFGIYVFKAEYLKIMKPGAVFVDVAIDQGGCGETSHVTTHDDPVYILDGVVHYCVGNMPGAVPRTSTIALTNATLRYGLQIANNGLEGACKKNDVICSAVNTYKGKLTFKGVADAFNYEYTDFRSMI